MQTVNLNKAMHSPHSVSISFYLSFGYKHVVPIRTSMYSLRHKVAHCSS